VLGDDRRDPQPSPEALEIVFDGMTNLVDLEVARSLGGPVEWRFSDAEPWHLVVTNGHAEAKPGGAGVAALAFEMTTSEWAKLAVERTSPLKSVATRKLKLRGSLHAKRKASKLFKTA
jgi:hypothetical protein